MTRPSETVLPRGNLDVLRAIAVSCVVGFHLAMAVRGSALGIDWIGRAGVLLFFVHTSLVLMGNLERGGDEPGWVGRFYVQRATRIYPLAIVAVLAVVALGVPAWVPMLHPVANPAFTAPSLRAIVANLGLVQNLTADPNLLSVLWSLPLEVQMYVALPVCYLVAERGVRSVGVLFAVAVGLGGVFALGHEHVPGLERLSVLAFGPCFMAGVLAYALLRRLRPTVGAGWWVPGLAIALTNYWRLGYASTAAQWGLCLAVGLAIPMVRELPTSRFTQASAIVAKYSYGVYLLHVPAMRMAFAISRNAWVALPLALLLTAGLSYVAFHLIERPGIELGKRFTSRPQLPPPAPALAA